MIYVHCMGPDWDRYRDQMESIVPSGNGTLAGDKDRDQGPLFPIVPIPVCNSLISIACSVNKD